MSICWSSRDYNSCLLDLFVAIQTGCGQAVRVMTVHTRLI